MLHEFLAENHEELAVRCKVKVAERAAPKPTADELEFGIPLLIEQLVTTLRSERTGAQYVEKAKVPSDIGTTAVKHGNELLRKGFTVDQVVHDYGDLCQALTELAHEKNVLITVDEFHTFNRCLDNAIAGAVSEFGRQRDRLISDEGVETMNERLGSLSHELRNLLNTAMLAFQAVKSGNVALTGATGGVLGRSLIGLRDLIDRSLADVRLTDGLQARREPINIHEIFDEIQISAALEASAKGITFAVTPVDKTLAVDADRQMLSSAIANLLQNAFKFTRTAGNVSLAAHAAADRVIIDVQDECGGLPPGKTEELFLPFKQRSDDRSGVGLGLSISRRSVEANGGKLRARDLPGKGCIFTIDLPKAMPTA
jgi:signal transduction histidine kinase